MSNRFKLIAAMSLIAAMFYQSSRAQVSGSNTDVPRLLSYQGQVKQTDGTPMNGTHTITASLYSDSHGKNTVWRGSYSAEVVNGVFTILLGSGNSPLPDVFAMNRPMWVGVSVDNQEEMKPFAQLAGVPYALNIPDQSVTMAKLSPEVISSIGSIKNPTPQGVPDRIALSDAGGTNFGPGTQGTTCMVMPLGRPHTALLTLHPMSVISCQLQMAERV